ncbi:hypothetical protein, partial [Caballeronia calidae]|uniref:hypothetical protein n=1 Tax=Caballeronia calidae TaxID=1777139 RepID=UPI000A58B8B0
MKKIETTYDLKDAVVTTTPSQDKKNSVGTLNNREAVSGIFAGLPKSTKMLKELNTSNNYSNQICKQPAQLEATGATGAELLSSMALFGEGPKPLQQNSFNFCHLDKKENFNSDLGRNQALEVIDLTNKLKRQFDIDAEKLNALSAQIDILDGNSYKYLSDGLRTNDRRSIARCKAGLHHFLSNPEISNENKAGIVKKLIFRSPLECPGLTIALENGHSETLDELHSLLVQCANYMSSTDIKKWMLQRILGQSPWLYTALSDDRDEGIRQYSKILKTVGSKLSGSDLKELLFIKGAKEGFGFIGINEALCNEASNAIREYGNMLELFRERLSGEDLSEL